MAKKKKSKKSNVVLNIFIALVISGGCGCVPLSYDQ